jgi:hypothetical protein
VISALAGENIIKQMMIINGLMNRFISNLPFQITPAFKYGHISAQ